jgi:hypothetical protein
MKLELLKAGEHMTQKEINFLYLVIGMIVQSGYTGNFFELVGGRSQRTPHWISYSCFYNYLHDRGVEKTNIDKEYWILNALAKNLNLCHDRIPELLFHLPSKTPSIIEGMLTNKHFALCLGSDIDLLIKGKGPPEYYPDNPYPQGTGQIVDVYKNVTGRIQSFPGWLKPSHY